MKGFLLTHDYRDRRGRCEYSYYGIGEEGPFLLRISNSPPLFFINRDGRISGDIRAERRPVNLVDFNGRPVDALYFNTRSDYFAVRELLREQGVTLYESDIYPPERFLMERFLRGGVEIDGTVSLLEGHLKIYENPHLTPADYRPEFRILSLDIETGQSGELYSIALHGSGRVTGPEWEGADDYPGRPGEKARVFMTGPDGGEESVLASFMDWFSRYDPDIIIGWHVIGFDLMFLENKSRTHAIPLNLGRRGEPIQLAEKRSGIYSAHIPGRLVIDGPPTLRAAFYKFENYTLETVAHELLGRGKDIRPDEDKVAEIERRYREDKEALGAYNLEDCVLVTEIFRKTAILEQLVTRSLIAGMALDRVSLSVASFDFFYLPRLHRKGMVAPDTSDITSGEHAAGGHVFSSPAGVYSPVAVLDFKSLYPSLIRTFHIDPWSRLNGNKDPLRTPGGISFSRTEAILPDFLEELMERRAKAKREGDDYLSQAVKILMNSFYGVMGTTGCRFYHADLPTAITGTGQWVLKESSACLKSWGYDVIYGDTDSLFVTLPDRERGDARLEEEAQSLASRVTAYWEERLDREFRLESHLELEWEKLYRHFLIPPIRGSREGATKRYAGMKMDGEIELKGLEFVRSDWTRAAREFQYELFTRFFALLKSEQPDETPLKEWLRDYVDRLKAGELDDRLVYKKRLTKKAEGYTKSTPPHVKAVRMLDEAGIHHGRDVEYVMTPSGPVPLQLKPSGIDYPHYIEKQIKPLADGVLFALDITFDGIIEGEQLDLFG